MEEERERDTQKPSFPPPTQESTVEPRAEERERGKRVRGGKRGNRGKEGREFEVVQKRTKYKFSAERVC